MLRARLANLVVAGGLSLVCGCANLGNGPLLSRFNNRNNAPNEYECIGAGGVPMSEGPMLQDYGPYMTPPSAAPTGGCPGLMPQATVPPLSAPPRIEPVPAQPDPYRPTRARDLR